jgi:MoxR-like ATPase
MSRTNKIWPIFQGNCPPHNVKFPVPPPWRRFDGQIPKSEKDWEPPSMVGTREEKIGSTYIADHKTIEMVNAALFLCRPLLVTGKAGTGKSSLAYAIAYELKLGQVLHWPITSRSTLESALYKYDAIGRLHDVRMSQKKDQDADGDLSKESKNEILLEEMKRIGNYIRLGPLGTALLPAAKPRVLLIDEIDKSNIDLPNDLLHVFETGEFEIPELARLREELSEVKVLVHGEDRKVLIKNGKVKCYAFPLVILTSNGERELPPPFLRRCIRLNIDEPKKNDLARIVARKFMDETNRPEILDESDEIISIGKKYDELIAAFLDKQSEQLSTDQLLNAVYLRMQAVNLDDPLDPKSEDSQKLIDAILRPLRGI